MSLVVNTNVGSLNAQRSLAASGAELKTAMERLSSGKKINSAADDAAGFAIAERMTAQIRGLNMATKNANDGLSMLAVIENATNDVTDMLQRMRELAIQATNDTNGSVDRAFLQEEVNQLIQEIDRVATQTQYNGQALLDGTFSNKSIQIGVNDGDTISVSVSSIEAKSLGVEYLQVGKVTHFVHYPDSDQTYLESAGAETNFEVLETGSLVTFGENRDQAFEVLDEPNIWEGAGNGGANIAVGHGFDTDGVRHVPELVEGETAVFKVGELSISNLDLSANPQKSPPFSPAGASIRTMRFGGELPASKRRSLHPLARSLCASGSPARWVRAWARPPGGFTVRHSSKPASKCWAVAAIYELMIKAYT